VNGWSETESWVVMGVPLSSRMEILTGCDLLGELWMVPVTVLLGKLVLRLWTWRFQEWRVYFFRPCRLRYPCW